MANLLQTLRTRVGRSVAYGRQPTPLPRPYQEMGVSGTAVWGGYVQVKERSPEWVGRQKWVTSSELAVNTSIVAAGVHYFLNLVAYPEWTVRPSDDSDEESLALAEFTDHVLNHMDTPWYKVVRRAAMYRFYGFGIQEWTAKHREDGLIGLKDVEARPQHTIEQWDVDIDGTVLGCWQRSPQTGHMLGLPRDKVLYLVEDTLTDNPEGIGMFRHIADAYKRLKQLQELEIRAYERDLRGIPIARAPLTYINRAIKQGAITPEEATRTLNDMRGMVELQVKQSDTGLVLDSLPYFSDSDAGDQVSAVPQWGFELLSGAGVGHAEIAAAIDRVQREIARIIGVEHLMMGDTGGNRSLSEDKSRNLYLIANSVLKYIASQVKSDIVVPLWRLNGFPMDKMPEVETEDVTFKNAEAITAALQHLSSAGAPLAPNDPVINDLRDMLGIARVPDDLMAQGAMQPNPALAGIPPELQDKLGGGKFSQSIKLPGKAPGLGGGGPGKQPGFGGGAMPGKGGFDPTKKARGYLAEQLGVDDEEDGAALGPLQEPSEPTRNGFAVAQPQRAKPNGQANGAAVASAPAPAESNLGARVAQDAADGSVSLDVNGPKPGGKVEVDSGLLVRLLERFAGGSVDAQPPTPPGGPAVPPDAAMDAGKPTAEGIAEGAVDGKDPAVEGAAVDAGPMAEGAKGLPKPAAGAAGKPVAGKPKPAAEGKPAAPGKPKVDPKTGKPVEAAGKPKVDPVTGKPMPPEAGVEGAEPEIDPVTGQPVAQPSTKPKIDPKTGQPMVDPATGKPIMEDGTPAQPQMEDMDIERAVEILEPYVGGNPKPGIDQEESETESDMLYNRLGDEKEVQPNVTDPGLGGEANLGKEPIDESDQLGMGNQLGEPAEQGKPMVDPRTGLPLQPDEGAGEPVGEPTEEEAVVEGNEPRALYDALEADGVRERSVVGMPAGAKPPKPAAVGGALSFDAVRAGAQDPMLRERLPPGKPTFGAKPVPGKVPVEQEPPLKKPKKPFPRVRL